MASSARIDELRKKFDENPRRYFAPLANEYRKAGDLDQAIFICQEYLPQQPGHMSGHIVYAQTLFEMARHDEAKAVFETALSLDPENLIALRHLGDIARQAGDSSAARIWYQRVLEADPRNEEIAQIMISLLAEPEPAVAQVSAASATPMSIPIVPTAVADEEPTQQRQSAPNAWTLEEDTGAGLDIEKSVDKTQLESSSPAAEVTSMPADAESGHEWLDLNNLTIGGVAMGAATTEENHEPIETTNWTDTPTRADVEPEPSDNVFVAFNEEGTVESPIIESGNAGGFELGHDDDQFEADPFAIAATPDNQYIEPTSDAPTGFSSDEMAEASAGTETESPVDGLEQFEAGFMTPAPAVDAIETKSFFGESTGAPEAAASHDAAAPPPNDEAVVAEGATRDSSSESTILESSFVESMFVEARFESLPSESATDEQAHDTVREPVSEPAVGDLSSTDSVVPETPDIEALFADSPSHEVWVAPSAVDETPVDDAVAESVFVETTSEESAGSDAVEMPTVESSVGEPIVDEAFADRVTDESPSVGSSQSTESTESASGDTSFEPVAEFTSVESTVVESAFEPPPLNEPVFAEPEPVESTTADTAPVETVESSGDEPPHDEQPADGWRSTEEPAPVEEMFVTETMAELYLRQGHLESAIDIFRKLVDQRPADEALRDRLHVVEAQLFDERSRHFSTTPAAAQEAHETVAENAAENAAEVSAGPTIREFLTGLTARRHVDLAEAVEPSHAVWSEHGETVENFDAIDTTDGDETYEAYQTYESVDVIEDPNSFGVVSHSDDFGDAGADDSASSMQSTMPAPPLPEARWTTPMTGLAALNETQRNSGPVKRATPNSAGETVTGSIDALFSGAGSSAADASAAAALAEAFADEAPVASPLAGVPAHRASNELRLDHVFKANAPPRSDVEDEGFSFDQFFADDMGDPAAGASGDAGAPSPEATDDIAQFNAWLNGLKKT